jgi:hypothetical protein
MGRPVNKRFFGEGPGNQIKIRAKVGSEAEGAGFIIRQRSTRRFEVNVDGDIGVCTLVEKAAGALADNEMAVDVVADDGQVFQATKIFNRTVVADGKKTRWNFELNFEDGAVQIPDESADIKFLVTFNIGDGARTGGGELEQFVVQGTDATAPTITPPAGFTFSEWDADFTDVQGNLVVNAVYSSL